MSRKGGEDHLGKGAYPRRVSRFSSIPSFAWTVGLAAHWPLRWAVIQVDSLAAKGVAESMWLQNRMRQPADVDTLVSAAIAKIFFGLVQVFSEPKDCVL